MGKIKSPEQALLFAGALYSDHEVFVQSKEILIRKLGDSLFVSPPLQWDYSSYYRDELGWPVMRQFIFFRNPIDPGNLTGIKLLTNEIEDSFSVDDKRRINLDPGLSHPVKDSPSIHEKSRPPHLFRERDLWRGDPSLHGERRHLQAAPFYLHGLSGEKLHRCVHECAADVSKDVKLLMSQNKMPENLFTPTPGCPCVLLLQSICIRGSFRYRMFSSPLFC